MDTIAVELSDVELTEVIDRLYHRSELVQKMLDARNKLRSSFLTGIHQVFSHWQKVHKKEKNKLDKKRETRIRNMLKTFSVDELKQAIDGALKDDWLMGKGKAPRAYNGLETILRDAAQVERLIELGTPRITVTVKHMSVADVIPEVAKGGYI